MLEFTISKSNMNAPELWNNNQGLFAYVFDEEDLARQA